MVIKVLRLIGVAWVIVALAGCLSSSAHTIAPPSAPYAAVARGQVDVPGGLLDLLPMTEGEVQSVMVVPQQRVNKGQVLARLNEAQADTNVDVAKARWHQAQAQLAALKLQVPGARETARRWASAAKAGAAEAQHADTAKERLLQLQGRIQVARMQIQLSHQQLLQAETALTTYVLRAPVAGRVVSVNIQVGSHVSPQMSKPAFVLLPRRALIVRAEVNESFVHNLRLGMKATLTLDAQPDAPPIPARLKRIGDVLHRARLDVDPASQQRRVVECILSFKPTQPLLIGQHLMVKFDEPKH